MRQSALLLILKLFWRLEFLVKELFYLYLKYSSHIQSLLPDNMSSQMYEMWLNEPSSVMERRTSFLDRMGLVEFDRITECSGTMSDSTSVIEGDSLVSLQRDFNGEAKCMDDEFDHGSIQDSCSCSEDGDAESCFAGEQNVSSDATTSSSEEKDSYVEVCATKKTMSKWWKPFSRQLRKIRKGNTCHVTKEAAGEFSPDGQFLAIGGADGVVRVWRVELTGSDFLHLKNDGKLRTYLPEKVMKIEESPLQEFHGHTSDVINLAWSSSNLLLSSSNDGTVRHWQLGSDECLGVFNHNNYVTSIQFNPVDENYFISGCIDGMVRIWGVREKRVVNWTDVHDIVTALCYQPDARGFVVGSISGTCRFYDTFGSEASLNSKLQICKRRKSSGNRVTGIQFVDNYSRRVMITSEDSKIRILDGAMVVKKFKANDPCAHFFADVVTSKRFSFADWFSKRRSSSRVAAWPEEKLP